MRTENLTLKVEHVVPLTREEIERATDKKIRKYNARMEAKFKRLKMEKEQISAEKEQYSTKYNKICAEKEQINAEKELVTVEKDLIRKLAIEALSEQGVSTEKIASKLKISLEEVENVLGM